MPQICTPPDGWRGNRLLPRDAWGWRQAVGVASRSVTGFPAADMKLPSETPPRASETAGETRVPSPVEHLKDMALECRQVAAACHDAGVRRELMLVAERFERLAELRQQGKASSTAPAQSKTDA
jgi:hypothetical protein